MKSGANIKIVLSIAVLLIILSFVVYGNVLKGDFVWDDYHLVKDNMFIRTWGHIPDFFYNDIGSGAGMKFGFFRPLQGTMGSGLVIRHLTIPD